ncbi:MAG TPA: tetratricopeptide repeat protein [Chloroflexia bacterium]|jgi:predicted ATPase/transcriptional regulator with XRE-family HTH domain/Tfp pilus assembly protein PilF
MGDGMRFGAWLKQRRKVMGLTQAGLAECVGCSVRTVIQIELGERRPSKQIAELLAKCVNVPSQEVPAFVEYARETPGQADAQTPMPWSSQQRSPNNLPAPPTAFIGRERETAAACALLRRAEVRLVTMTGAPGIGKTRLSLQVASALTGDPDFRDGVFFVALASIRDPGLVASTIARTLKVQEAPGQPLLERLKEALRDRRMLLLLDNFEHVIPGAPVLADLLVSAPGLKVLATSRALLHLYGEYEFPVHSLTLPDPGEPLQAERLAQYEAVRLFTERAVAAKFDFAITDENAALIAGICIQLEGLPLAIELAAARTRDLTPQAIASRLHSKLDLLVGGPQDLPARQQTLRAAIDWSYDLLNGREQAIFRRMSVFVGGCKQEAVQAVCLLESELEVDLPGSIASLVDKSLLQQEPAGEDMRLRMLEITREYAWERLAGSESREIQKRHTEYYLSVAEAAEPQLKGGQQITWLERLEAEHNNLRAALRWSLQHGEVEIALRLGSALWRFWLIRGYLSEGREWLEEALALGKDSTGAVPATVRANALNGAGNLAYSAGDYAAALVLHEESLRLRRELGDKQGMAGALNNIAVVWRDRGDYERASTYFEESLSLKRELGDKMGIASSLNNLGVVRQRQSNYDAAQACCEESLLIWRESGEKYGIATALTNLGILQGYRGNYEAARSLHEESLLMRRDLGDKLGISTSLGNIATVVVAQGDYVTARSLHEENLAIRREHGDKPGMAHSFYDLGFVMHRQGDLKQAAWLIKESLSIWRDLGNKQGIAECLAEMAVIAVSMAQAKKHKGQQRATLERAARLIGAAEALSEAIGFQLQRADRDGFDHKAALACAQLGQPTWEALRAEGRALTMEQAVALASRES